VVPDVEDSMMMKTCGVVAVLAGLAVGSAWAVQGTTKNAYIVVQVDVTNAQQYAEYMKVSPDIIAKFGGRFIARGGRTATLEGPPARSRVVVIEFPSFERAQQFYQSSEYQAARKLRANAANAQFVLVEGQ
jgi:uncharacterized protein (DUF1330 family)